MAVNGRIRWGNEAWRALCRKFVEENVNGNCHEWDEAKEIPNAVLQKFAETGVLGCMVGHPWPAKSAFYSCNFY